MFPQQGGQGQNAIPTRWNPPPPHHAQHLQHHQQPPPHQQQPESQQQASTYPPPPPQINGQLPPPRTQEPRPDMAYHQPYAAAPPHQGHHPGWAQPPPGAPQGNWHQGPPPPGPPGPYVHGHQPPAPRQRTAIACRYCRRRKIRCSGFENTDDGRCSHCIRFNQDCIFTPVSAQTQAFVPAHTVWRGHQGQHPPQMFGAYGQPLPPVYGPPQPGPPTQYPPHLPSPTTPGSFQAHSGYAPSTPAPHDEGSRDANGRKRRADEDAHAPRLPPVTVGGRSRSPLTRAVPDYPSYSEARNSPGSSSSYPPPPPHSVSAYSPAPASAYSSAPPPGYAAGPPPPASQQYYQHQHAPLPLRRASPPSPYRHPGYAPASPSTQSTASGGTMYGRNNPSLPPMSSDVFATSSSNSAASPQTNGGPSPRTKGALPPIGNGNGATPQTNGAQQAPPSQGDGTTSAALRSMRIGDLLEDNKDGKPERSKTDRSMLDKLNTRSS